MKIKVLSRNPDDYIRETKKDIHRVTRNYDPSLHPFESGREYTRALNATKLERVFAKPFLGCLEGHSDGIHCMCKHPRSLSLMLSGSYDGEIKLWNLPKRQCVRSLAAHDGYVRGMCFHPSGEYFFSCGEDKTIKQWSMAEGSADDIEQPVNTILGKTVYQGMDHHWRESMFATCGEKMDIWDESRTEPVKSYTWGVNTLHSVKYNPIERHLVAACASDRSILFYDTRKAAPLRKVVMKLRANTLAWNPMESFVFTAASEDNSLYAFDMRNLKKSLHVYMNHVAAVMDVDYSPTGQEIVSGSYDKTIRIYTADNSQSREIYHTKRMQRVHCVKWSLDNKFIMSGSDEMNIRVWKAYASDKLGTLHPREKEATNYNEKLKDKFRHHPQIKRISRHRHVPRLIYTTAREHREIRASMKRKEENVRRHSRPGSVPVIKEKSKHIVKEVH